MTLFVAILALLGADITDLGTMTERRAIFLEKCTNRVDFAAFNIEIQSMVETNIVLHFTTTNEFLRFSDLSSLPDGRVAMAVQMVCADGSTSPANLYRMDVKHSPPNAPTAVMITVLDGTVRPAARAGAVRSPRPSLIQQAIQSKQLDLTNNGGPPLPRGGMEENPFYDRRRRSTGELGSGRPREQ